MARELIRWECDSVVSRRESNSNLDLGVAFDTRTNLIWSQLLFLAGYYFRAGMNIHPGGNAGDLVRGRDFSAYAFRLRSTSAGESPRAFRASKQINFGSKFETGSCRWPRKRSETVTWATCVRVRVCRCSRNSYMIHMCQSNSSTYDNLVHERTATTQLFRTFKTTFTSFRTIPSRMMFPCEIFWALTLN